MSNPRSTIALPGLLLFFLVLCHGVCLAEPQWAWQRGDQSQNFQPILGTAGVAAPANRPGGRNDAAICADKAGHLWLFGGYGINDEGKPATLNDLWRYDIASNQWTWFKGTFAESEGVYGTRGKAAPANVPPCRIGATLWADGDGKIWLFGGLHWNDPVCFGADLNDLWCFDPALRQWRWVRGSAHAEAPSVHDLPGVESDANTPGSRLNSQGFVDSHGRLWLLGGNVIPPGTYHDAWYFNPHTECWVWMGARDSAATAAGAGSDTKALGCSSVNLRPHAREAADAVVERFHFYGEIGYTDALWRCTSSIDGVKWELLSGSDKIDKRPVHGTQGVAASGNTPGSRWGAVVWPDDAGHLWLFGGYTFDRYSSSGTTSTENIVWVHMNDLWRFDLAAKQWTWVAGSALPDQPTVPGSLGSPGTGFPSARKTVGCRDSSGAVWVFGGDGPVTSSTHSMTMNDLWRLDPARLQWTWMHGDCFPQVGNYVRQSVASQAYYPRARQGMGAAMDKIGRLYLLGGETVGLNPNDTPPALDKWMNDLWRYDPKDGKWTWLKGGCNPISTWDPPPVGVSSPENATDRLSSMALWLDLKGRIWKFGGYNTFDEPYQRIYPSQTGLWRYDPGSGNWTMLYDVYDWTNTAPRPILRGEAGTWTGRDGKLWLMGGVGFKFRMTNDLWSLNPETTSWTLVRGVGDGVHYNQKGIYGRKGVPAPANLPGARRNPATWTDRHGNLWLFGGWGIGVTDQTSGTLNDLWVFNPATANWTWVSGTGIANPGGSYGKMGVAAASNVPPARMGAAAWVDDAGRFWIFGGGSSTSQTLKPEKVFNDLWQYDPLTGLWTWCAGSSKPNQAGTAGSPGQWGFSCIPGARYNAGAFSDGQGNFYLFGGDGYNDLGFCGPMNDFWKFSPGVIKNGADAKFWSRLN